MATEHELGRTALFTDAPEPILKTLAARAAPRRYRKGSVIFVQGEMGNRCFVILSGSVQISAFHPDGREAVLALLGPGDVFGELSLFDGAERSADATAMETSELLSLDADAVHEAVREHPDLAMGLLRVLATRLRQTNEALQDAAFFDVTGRLARRLADLADTHGSEEAEGTLIDLPLSQENLAKMVGATRESVNKALAGLARRDLVKRRGRRYVIRDVSQLRERAR